MSEEIKMNQCVEFLKNKGIVAVAAADILNLLLKRKDYLSTTRGLKDFVYALNSTIAEMENAVHD